MTHSHVLRYAPPLRCRRSGLCRRLVTAAPATLYAQSSASLSGTVLDPRGVPLPGATVSSATTRPAPSQKMTSDGQGKYSFASLAAGKYTVQVDAPGFATSQTPGCTDRSRPGH